MAIFEQALDHVLRWEGGYVNDPRDPGGETKYGISKRAYPNEDIKAMTKERAGELYRKDYWIAAGCPELRPALALAVFDTAVNCGVKRAKVWLAEAGGDLHKFMVRRATHYALLDSIDDYYAKGWYNRLLDIYRRAVVLDLGPR